MAACDPTRTRSWARDKDLSTSLEHVNVRNEDVLLRAREREVARGKSKEERQREESGSRRNARGRLGVGTGLAVGGGWEGREHLAETIPGPGGLVAWNLGHLAETIPGPGNVSSRGI